MFGAVVVDIFTSITERESFLNQGVFVGIEETIELLSLVIFVYAVADYLEIKHGSRLKAAWSHLKPKL